MFGLLTRLYRARVFQTLAIYIPVAWIITEIVTQATDSFGLPLNLPGLAMVLLVAGVPVVAFLAWAFQITEDGIRLEVTSLKGGLAIAVATSFMVAISVVLYRQLDIGPAPEIAKDSLSRLSQVSTPTLTSVEILPFLSPDSSLGTVFRGEIQERLARHADLNVVTSLDTPQLHKATDVHDSGRSHHQVRGEITETGDAYKLAIALSTTEGSSIWSDDFLFGADLQSQQGLQRRVARQLAESLESRVNTAEYCEPSSELQALENYHEARLLINRKGPENLNAAVALLKDAINLDPEYGKAYSALAITYLLQRRRGAGDLVVDLARQALNKCPTLGAAYKIWVPPYEGISNPLIDQELQWRDALAMEPNHIWMLDNYANFLTNLGMLREAYAITERLYRNNPNDPRAVVSYGWSMAQMGDDDYARQLAQKAKELGDESCNADMLRLMIEVQTSVSEAAIRDAYEAAPQRCKDAMLSGFEDLGPQNIYGVSNNQEKRRVVLEFLETTLADDPNRSMVWAISLGDPGLAFKALEWAHSKNRYIHWPAFWTRSENASLFRRDPRFVQYMKDQGVDEYWREFGWPSDGMCTPLRDEFVCEK